MVGRFDRLILCQLHLSLEGSYMETIELSGIIGLIAIACLAANFIVGFIIWKNIQITLPYNLTFLGLHKFTGYSAAIAIIVHVVLIPLDPKSKFTWSDLLLPLW